MANTSTYYVGTDLKFLISIEASGFSMDEDHYSVVLRCGGKEVPGDVVEGDNNEHYLIIDSSQFGSGTLKMIVYAEVPDEDFPDGARTEVAAIDLCELKRV